MLALTLDDYASIPEVFIKKLRCLSHLFQQISCVDTICQNSLMIPLIRDLECFLMSQPIRAYHCTREPLPGFFKKEGLRLTKLDQQQNEFMCSYGRLFTDCEKNHMRKAWHQYFLVEKNNIGRDNVIWFCLTKATYESHGVEPFLKLFGGEAIHKPLQSNKTICNKLQKIGSPVIVEVLLPPYSINLAGSPAKNLLNAWHRTIRHDVKPLEAETFVHCPVAPSDILNVWARW